MLDHDGWVALLQEDVEGRHPHRPWTAADARAAAAALAALGANRAPKGWPELPAELAPEFAAWSRLAAEVPDDLDPWATAHLGQLEALARTTLPRLAGDRVVHSDARSDNLIVEPGGAVRVVDWPWAARGAAWFDVASLLINIRVYATWTCNRSWQ